MRIDKFLNTVNLVKRRSVAQDMCINNAILVNGKIAKASREIKVGDLIEILFLEKVKKVRVVEIPTQKTIAKQDSFKYYKEENF
ncbi:MULTISPECIES: RNA-binding S4 domain-containing protein [unclassified Helicobacter]|uniref:RNA-binding S4 domain-containing protein n=1 Tax=unclassified Helicobacter TaxID=2593540 RepID=UPI000CF0C9E7|nr:MULTISPECIES: RNA-binding S4 domain-containing protein [unclassified Helicobacter]